MNLMQLPDEQNYKRQDPEEIKIGNVNSQICCISNLCLSVQRSASESYNRQENEALLLTAYESINRRNKPVEQKIRFHF